MTPYFADEAVTLHHGDALAVMREFDAGSADCIVTSPPYYGLRDYGVEGQYGLEGSPGAYVETLRELFAEGRRVLATDGVLWLNIGDSYSAEPPGRSENSARNSTLSQPGGTATMAMRESVRSAGIDRTKFLPRKNLMGIPWRVAFALQDDGWTLRNAVIWHKPNAMPESVTDRLSCDYEHLFLFSRSQRYWFDLDAIREPLAYPDALDGTRVFGGVNKGSDGKVGAAARRGGGHRSTYGKCGGPGDTPPGTKPQTNRGATGERHTQGHENGRNPGSVWDIPTQPFPSAHLAVMPTALAVRCIKSGCKPGGTVLDPFSGSGTSGLAATKLGRRYVGIDLNSEYLDLSLRTRLAQTALVDGEAS